jgi:hypothetical protein
MTLDLQEIEVPTIPKQSSHEGGKFVSPTQRLPLSPRRYSWYSLLLEVESTTGPSYTARRFKPMQNPNGPHRESRSFSSGL